MATDQVDELRAALGAQSDQDMAEKLGIDRTAVAQWRRRGVVPKRWLFLLRPAASAGQVREAMLNTYRVLGLGKREHHYWLRAALAFMPLYPDQMALPPAARGRALEHRITHLMGFASLVTNTALHKSRCETEADYEELIAAMAQRNMAKVLADIERVVEFLESPQSESSIGDSPQKP